MTRTEITAATAEPGDKLVSRNSAGYTSERVVLAADDNRIAFAQDTLHPGRQASSYTRLQWFKRTSPKVAAYARTFTALDGTEVSDTRTWEAGE